jgi:recombination protein RecT
MADEKQTTAPVEKSSNQAVAQKQKDIIENVVSRIKQMTATGAIKIPEGYAYENALRTAFFIISETKDRNDKPALEVCSPESISQSLFEMTISAMDASKKQCYFIVAGNKLTFRRSYFGSIALAKRVADVVKVTSAVIYKGDVFSYEMKDGEIVSLHHEQSIENLDSEIFGAYAIATYGTGEQHIEVMTFKKIKQSWQQSSVKNNNNLQTNFSEEACKRTVINRCLKTIINSSDDTSLFESESEDDSQVEDGPHSVVSSKTKEPVGSKVISMPVTEKKPVQQNIDVTPVEEVASKDQDWD